ncbi:hypothetical protein FO519_000519 [Halicephalobus sp. NKZ332]|nr:hypothetical protein FO519_000519 [Halicephalobus sp. NKZ332]
MSIPLVISSVTFKNNPAKWTDPFEVEVIFEAREDLGKPMEFQFVYVGSASDESLDQELERVECETVVKGRHKLNLEIDAPDPTKIPSENIHDVTLFMFKGYYNGKMFTKICWFVSNTYEDEEMQENKPTVPAIDKIRRELGIEDVRVTQFPCCWNEELPPVTADVDASDQGIAFSTSQDNPEVEGESDDEEVDDEEEMEEDMAELDIADTTLETSVLEKSANLSSNSSGIENVDQNAKKEPVKGESNTDVMECQEA